MNNPSNEDTYHKLGVEETISATRLMYPLIEQEVATSDVMPLSLLRRGNLEVVEVKLQPNSTALNIPIPQLSLPSGSLLTAVVRENLAQIVTGDTRLQEDDTVVVLTQPSALGALRQVLVGS